MFIGWIAPLLATLAAVAAVIIGLIVWFGERSNRLRITFLWLAVFVALWIASNVVFAVGPEAYRFIVALISYAAAMLVAVQTVFFTLRLVQKKLGFWIGVFLVVGYVGAIASALPGVVGMSVEGAEIVTRQVGILVYAVLLVGYLLTACVLLVISRRNAGRILRRQIKLVMYGVIIASVIGTTFNLALPIFGNYTFIQLGPAGATVFIAMIAYAIARYSLFDVRLAIVRGVAYLATFATLAAVYFAIAYAVAIALNSSIVSTGQMTLNVIAALVMALLLQPIKKFFDKLTDRVFYRDNYSTDDFFKEINQTLSSTNDLRALLERTANILATTLKSEQAFFFVYTGEHHHLSTGTNKHASLPLQDARFIDEYIATNKVEIIQENNFSHDHVMKRLLNSHRIALILPLVRSTGVLGYVCLGEKRSGGYTRRDMRLLGTIADELLIAIQNALSVQEVKDLNANLEQRIGSATKELRASNAQLQRLDEAKDEFISMASHQLRTPLTSIKGYISMIVEGDVGKVSPQQKHLLDEAFLSSERMVRLIGDFLNVSRLQTGKFIIEKHPINLAKVVAQELESLLPNAAARGQKFTYKEPKNFPELNLDESKFRQVIMNFADNAIYYSKDNSTIKVSLSVEGKEVMFTVKDTGIGVPVKEQDQLFGKFFRATNARKQRPDGTGVGLFLAKKVIDAHDGKTIFESKEGKGSTFGFRLPIPKN